MPANPSSTSDKRTAQTLCSVLVSPYQTACALKELELSLSPQNCFGMLSWVLLALGWGRHRWVSPITCQGCTLVVFTLLPLLQLHPERSGRTLHSSPSRHGSIWHHHFCSTMEAGGEEGISGQAAAQGMEDELCPPLGDIRRYSPSLQHSPHRGALDKGLSPAWPHLTQLLHLPLEHLVFSRYPR